MPRVQHIQQNLTGICGEDDVPQSAIGRALAPAFQLAVDEESVAVNVDDDEGALALAPRSLAPQLVAIGDEDLSFVVDEDVGLPAVAPRVAVSQLIAVFAVSDEDTFTAAVVIDSDDAIANQAARPVQLVVFALADEELQFVVDSDDTPALAAPKSSAPQLIFVDEDAPTTVIIADEDSNALAAPKIATPVAVSTDEDLVQQTTIVDEDTDNQSAMPRKPIIGTAVSADEEMVTALDEEAAQAHTAPRKLYAVLGAVDEETAVVLDDDSIGGVIAPKSLPASLSASADEESPTTVIFSDEDVVQAPVARLRLVPQLPATEHDETSIVFDEDATPATASPRANASATANADTDEISQQPVTVVDDSDSPASGIAPARLSLVPLSLEDELAIAPAPLALDEDASAIAAVAPARLFLVTGDSEELPPDPPSPTPNADASAGGTWFWPPPQLPVEDTTAEFLDEVESLATQNRIQVESTLDESVLVGAVATTGLAVEIYATYLEVEVIERGNLVLFLATFTGDPGAIYFAHVRPGESRPRVDNGYGAAGSRIARIGDGVYAVSIDTTGFEGGSLHWHFWSEGAHAASSFGAVEIKKRPPQLL